MALAEYVLVLGILLSVTLCAGAAEPLRLENENVALEFDADTGAWTGLVDKAAGDNLVATPEPTVPQGLPGASGPEGKNVLVSHERSEDGPTLTMTLRSGPWLVHAKYDLYSEGIGSRQFTLENAGDHPLVARGAGHVIPALLPGDEVAAIFPGSLPTGDLPIGRMALGEVMRPKSHDGLVYLWSEKAHRGVGAWFFTEDEYAQASVMFTARGAVLRHDPAVLAPVKPGEKVQLGRQFFWLVRGSRDDLLRSVQQVYKIIDLHAPTTSLENLCEKVLYCGHPGGPPELGYRTYGGFKALEAYVPTLRKMGVDLLWLLPIFEHGDGVKWNLYAPFDQFKISPLYGTPEDLKSLSAAAAKAGISLMFDLVPHGPPDVSPLAKAHPEWVCRDEAGKPVYEWGQLAFDDALPAWQDYMRRVAEFNVSEYGIVGVRVDVASGSPPNWNPATGYRPSHSSLGGGLGMIRAIREGLLKVRPRTILLPEDYTGLNVFCRDGDLTYDAQLFSLFIELQEQKALPSDWAARLQRFLHDQSLTLPPGALKMRWISNHDTVSWTYQRMRPRAAYGEERTKALLALCALIDGAPMIYQGDEDPAVYGGKGENVVDFIGAVNACRKRLPALAHGSADYQAVQASDGVFACLRQAGDDRAVVLVSFNPEAAKSRLALPEPLRSVRTWKDELSGEPVDAASVPMAGHQVRVLAPAADVP
ncbi:MAG: alpha-amylase family glycosyl hydrolase [Phycisphaerae bacterium]